jgi:hypothetical protein
MSAMIETEDTPKFGLRLNWTEQQVQDAVYIHCAIKSHEIIVPNSCVFAWESDVISVNKTGFINEYEIKVSRADFKQDAKKDRAALLLNPVVRRELWSGDIHETTLERPNYFFYAVPEGLVQPDEIPDYAGLIYVRRHVKGPQLYYAIASEVKPAKRLHREKITDKQRCQLARAITRRYWKQRLKALSGKNEAVY